MIILLLHFECMNILFQESEYIVCTNSYLEYKDLIILLESHLFFKSDSGLSCVPSISCLDLGASLIWILPHLCGRSSQMPLMDLKNLQFSLEDRDQSKIN
jgi:hypothetical protein